MKGEDGAGRKTGIRKQREESEKGEDGGREERRWRRNTTLKEGRKGEGEVRKRKNVKKITSSEEKRKEKGVGQKGDREMDSTVRRGRAGLGEQNVRALSNRKEETVCWRD